MNPKLNFWGVLSAEFVFDSCPYLDTEEMSWKIKIYAMVLFICLCWASTYFGGVQSPAWAFHLQTSLVNQQIPRLSPSVLLVLFHWNGRSDYLSAILSLVKTNVYSVFSYPSRMIWWFHETSELLFSLGFWYFTYLVSDYQYWNLPCQFLNGKCGC